MMAPTSNNRSTKDVIDCLQVELSSLVGRDIILFSEQFQGKPLTSKVILANERTVSIDRSGGAGLIDNLIDNQKVVVQFDQKGQRVSVNGRLKRSRGGRCSVILEKEAVPLSRRRFFRCEIPRLVKYAVIPVVTFNPQKVSRLRWIETDSRNFSSGGILISRPSHLGNDSYLLLNIEAKDFGFPALIIGQVRYCYPVDNSNFHVGIEYIINEQKERHFPLSTIKQLPPAVFEYTAARRSKVDKKLVIKMQTKQTEG